MKLLLSILVLTLNLTVNAQSAPKFNLDLEEPGIDGNLSKDWFRWGTYNVGTDTTTVYSGKTSGWISSGESGSSFGSIAYRIPANYVGETIQLEGFMKLEGVENGFAGLLLRMDGNAGTVGFDNMQGQNIRGTRDWKKYVIRLPYPKEAKMIYVGGLISGKGKVWFDGFKLSIDGKDVQTLREQKKPVYQANLDHEFDKGSKVVFPELNERLIGKLALLGKIWGFLKYHHPEVGKGNYNWDYELFRMLPKYLETKDTAERNQLLISWINQYGTVPECKECKETAPDAFVKPDHSWIEDAELGNQLVERLTYIYENRYQGEHFYIKLAPRVGNPKFLNENAYTEMPYPDAGFRLLALYRYWNMIQYFFPNKHLMDKDWGKVLNEYIADFINAKDELQYELAAVRLIGDIQDTHANLWGGNDKMNEWKGSFYAPVHVRFIEDKLVVTDYYNPELKPEVGLEIGDVITHIGGTTVENIVKTKKVYYPASNGAARMRDISADLLRSQEKEINIKFISKDGMQQEKNLKLYERDSLDIYRWYRRGDDETFKFLKENIGYITLESIKIDEIEEIKNKFRDTDGIIIDIRNYPSAFVPFVLGSYFTSSETPFVRFSNGNTKNPGEFTLTEPVKIPGSADAYQGKLIVLVNELSQSQAEYTAMAFRAGENTTIVGSTTAGADGNVSTIMLPGGLRTMISGIGVYYPDGTETQRVGIVPDIVVKPTIKGIRNGKDEVLEKALEIIEQQNN